MNKLMSRNWRFGEVLMMFGEDRGGLGRSWEYLGKSEKVWGRFWDFWKGLGKVLVMFGDFWEGLGRSIIIIICPFGSVSSDEVRTYQRHHLLITRNFLIRKNTQTRQLRE